MSVLLKDLSDYIQPSQACVKPVDATLKKAVKEASVKISLNDCLACSGCITSAESILVSLQTSEELFKALDSGQRVVVSVSSQSVASIAFKYQLSLPSVLRKLSWFFRFLQVEKVFDLSMANCISVYASSKEFEMRKDKHELPMICASCPGWICYAEKTCDYILPNISKVKSAQQIMGSWVKKVYGDVFHVCVMPCYDKKLEASRKEFELADQSGNLKKDVDCVLTTSEIEKLWIERNLNFNDFEESELDSAQPSASSLNFFGVEGSSAGGFLEFLLQTNKHDSVQVTQKSKDLVEYTVYKGEDPVLTFASVYGFKNIQNLIRKIKLKKCVYDYVEVMACPGACAAGGGQLAVSDKDFKLVEERYRSAEIVSPFVCEESEMYKELDKSGLLWTEYRAIPKETFNINTQW